MWQYDEFDVAGSPTEQSPVWREGPSGTQGSNSKANWLVLTNNMLWEGGAKLIHYLLSAAIQPSDRASGNLPDVRNVHEWHFRDLMHFPEAARKEWKTTCFEELESLEKHDIFELTDLPKGHKTVGCRWVFDVKTDSHKKARLVTQGFSQVEGVDYNQLFSPVVWFESIHLMLALTVLRRQQGATNKVWSITPDPCVHLQTLTALLYLHNGTSGSLLLTKLLTSYVATD